MVGLFHEMMILILLCLEQTMIDFYGMQLRS
nr:MAG TPA: hypothetical protein [Crassvirales sp.]